MSKETRADVIIVGAGLTGITAARLLQKEKIDVLVLDKGRSIGGRMATRRIADGIADHGAQFFTVRSEIFREHVDQWLKDDWVYEWSKGWNGEQDGHPRYVARGGMNQLVKQLAKPLKRVGVNERVVRLSISDDEWQVMEEDMEPYHAKVVILTPPVPQAISLIDAGNIQLTGEERLELDRIKYGECLCGLFHIEGDFQLPEPGALQKPEDTFTWIADNQRKGISPDAKLITLHAGVEFSKENYTEGDEVILEKMRPEITSRLKGKILEEQVKRWRYSIPLTYHPLPYHHLNVEAPLYFAGDAFGNKGRVEGAFLSGFETAQAVMKKLWET